MKKLSIVLFIFLLISCSGQQQPEEYSFSGLVMGTSYTVKVVSQSEFDAQRQQKLEADIAEQLKSVDQAMSTYKMDSEISRFNKWPVGRPFSVSANTRAVIQAAIELNAATKGGFDITVSPLVDLWGFGPQKKETKVPEDTAIQALLAQSGVDAISIQDGQLIKQRQIELDLSAIAKGFGVDQVAEYLIEQGEEQFLVEVGGEIAARGLNARNTSWVLAIEQPDFNGRKAYNKVFLQGEALATSGDYRNYYELDGQRFSHLIDPRSGYPVSHRLASVSVVAEKCAEADAWATALMVLGEVEGFELAEKRGIAAFFIYRKADGFESRHTSGFKPYLDERG